MTRSKNFLRKLPTADKETVLVVVSIKKIVYSYENIQSFKVHIFWEAHKILQNLHCRFDCHYIGQIYDGDFAKICGLLRIYELYQHFKIFFSEIISSHYLLCIQAELY